MSRTMNMVLAAVVGAALCGSTAYVGTAAAQTSGARTAPAAAGDWIRPSASKPGLVDVDFPGGTLKEFVEGINRKMPTTNAVVTPDADIIMLPPITVREMEAIRVLMIPARLLHGLDATFLEAGDASGAEGQPAGSRGAIVFRVDPDMARQLRQGAGARTPTFDLTFGGGTVADYAAAIRKTHPAARVVIMPGVEKFPAPAVELKAVTLEAAIQAVAKQHMTFADGSAGSLTWNGTAVGNDREELYTLIAEFAPAPSSVKRTSITTVAELIDDRQAGSVRPEDLLSAVNAALSLYETPAVVKYHPETKLLMVRGTGEQIDAVGELIGNLRSTVHDERGRAAEGGTAR